MTPSKILFFLCSSFVIGIFFESAVKIPQIFLWAFLVIAILIIFISTTLWIRSYSQGKGLKLGLYLPVTGFCLLLSIIGVLRMQISEFNIANDELRKLNGKGAIILEGIISAEPDIKDAFQKLKVMVADSTVLITTNRYPEYKYLDKIKISGKLDTNGSNPEMLKNLIDNKLIDYTAMDIKVSREKYSAFLREGVKLEDIEKSVEILKNNAEASEFRTTVVPNLHEKEDFIEIAKWIGGPEIKYYLQNFRPEKTIDPAFEKTKPHPDEWLKEVAKKISPHFKLCQVR